MALGVPGHVAPAVRRQAAVVVLALALAGFVALAFGIGSVQAASSLSLSKSSGLAMPQPVQVSLRGVVEPEPVPAGRGPTSPGTASSWGSTSVGPRPRSAACTSRRSTCRLPGTPPPVRTRSPATSAPTSRGSSATGPPRPPRRSRSTPRRSGLTPTSGFATDSVHGRHDRSGRLLRRRHAASSSTGTPSAASCWEHRPSTARPARRPRPASSRPPARRQDRTSLRACSASRPSAARGRSRPRNRRRTRSWCLRRHRRRRPRRLCLALALVRGRPRLASPSPSPTDVPPPSCRPRRRHARPRRRSRPSAAPRPPIPGCRPWCATSRARQASSCRPRWWAPTRCWRCSSCCCSPSPPRSSTAPSTSTARLSRAGATGCCADACGSCSPLARLEAGFDSLAGRGRAGAVTNLAGMLLLLGLVYGFLSPQFGPNGAGLVLVLSIGLGLGVLLYLNYGLKALHRPPLAPHAGRRPDLWRGDPGRPPSA